MVKTRAEPVLIPVPFPVPVPLVLGPFDASVVMPVMPDMPVIPDIPDMPVSMDATVVDGSPDPVVELPLAVVAPPVAGKTDMPYVVPWA
jgi:hypothetical protein